MAFNVSDFADCYTLYYRHGMNANLTKNFIAKGGQKEAYRRALHHCEIMNYRFVFIRPLIVDLDQEEAYKLSPGVVDLKTQEEKGLTK